MTKQTRRNTVVAGVARLQSANRNWLLLAMVCLITLAGGLQAQDAFPIPTDQSTDPQEFNFDLNADGFNTDEFSGFGEDGFQVEQPLDPAAAAVLAAITIAMVLLAIVCLLFAIFMAYQLSSSLSAIPEPYRQMQAFMPWLIFVPLAGIVIFILAMIKVPRSVSAYLTSIGDSSQGDCGEKLGLWGAVLYLLGCTAPIGIVLLIMSLLKLGKAKALAKAASGL